VEEMKLPSIKECDRNTRLVYTFGIDTALTIVAYLMMPGILGGYYNNFVIHSPTIWYDAPSSILAWCPILNCKKSLLRLNLPNFPRRIPTQIGFHLSDGAFFVIMFGVVYMALWAVTQDIVYNVGACI
jgi:hypothetical protein